MLWNDYDTLFIFDTLTNPALTPDGLYQFRFVGYAADAHAQSGQRAFGQSTVEPAINYADGSTVYLLTPDKAPFPAKANAAAVAPLYLPAYPSTSTIDPSILNCQPNNCDHVNVLPFAAPGYPNGGNTCLTFGLPAGQCSLLIGHDHLVGIPPTGDYNVAWAVVLVVFTPQAFQDGAINNRILTLQQIEDAIAAGDAFTVETPIVFNCQMVSPTVYSKATPLIF